jgi:hypothetical protein
MGGRGPQLEATMLDANKDPSLPSGGGLVTSDEPSAAELFLYAVGVARQQILVVLVIAMLGATFGAFLTATPPLVKDLRASCH